MPHYDERELCEMINSALDQQRQKLKRCLRNSEEWHQCGRYLIENKKTGQIVEGDIDLLQLGKQLGVIGENDSVHYRR